MENNDWVLPFSCCFVIKELLDYDAINCAVTVRFLLILRIKFTGYERLIKAMLFVEQ